MKQALLEAHKAGERGEVPVGAVVVCKDRIIARAHHLTETLTAVTAHAEMQAITAAAATLGGTYLHECTLYVTVEPCVMCAGAIAWAQMGRLVFGAEEDVYKRQAQRRVRVADGKEGIAKQSLDLKVSKPHRWNLDNPYLYTLKTERCV